MDRASEWEIEHWRKVARACAEIEEEPSSRPPRIWPQLLAWINDLRVQDGLPPFKEDTFDEPPELEFYRLARARGLLRRPDQLA
jgi:hypothetical protein